MLAAGSWGKETMDENPISVLIADDHPMLRKGLRLTIEEDPGLTVVGEASDGEMALAMLTKLRPDVAVLDIDMPKLDGFGVAREAIRQGLAVDSIFLTLHLDEDMFQAALELGAKGYILKDSAAQEIVAGIRSVAAGRPFYSSAIAAQMMQRHQSPAGSAKSDPASQLSPTERKIMHLIAGGKSSKEIGTELSIHYRTVENHRTNICRKLNLDGEGANALLRFALQNKSNWQANPRQAARPPLK
jgi:DNA-binding NarL/FixJ family response regulator